MHHFKSYFIGKDLVESFIGFLDSLKDYDQEIVFDIETNGNHIKKAITYGFSIALGDEEAFYFPIRDRSGNYYFDEDLIRKVVSLVSSTFLNKKLIGHNIIFDVLVWKNEFGFDLTGSIYCDTILLKHAINENPPHGLKETAKKYLGDWAVDEQNDLKESIKSNGGSVTKTSFELHKADTEIIGKYCNKDVILTYLLYVKFSKVLESEGLSKLFYEDEIMPTYKEVIIPMKDKGFPVDLEFFKQCLLEITKDIEEIKSNICNSISESIQKFEKEFLEKKYPIKVSGNFPKAVASVLGVSDALSLKKKDILSKSLYDPFVLWFRDGDESQVQYLEKYFDKARRVLWENSEGGSIFNLGSSDHLAWLFFEEFKVTPKVFTDSGAPSTSADTLDELAGEHPVVDKILEMRQLEKLKSTYFEPVLEKSVNGILYSDVLMFGTTSGRMAGKDPNLMNLPSGKKARTPLVKKYSAAVRKGMIAGKGNVVIDRDFCLHPSVEVLTPTGWVTIDNLGDNQVYQVDRNTLKGSFTKPIRVVDREYSGYMYSYNSLRVTEDHTMLAAKDDRNYIAIKSQQEVPGFNKIFTALKNTEKSNFSNDEVQKAILLELWGSLNSDKTYEILCSSDGRVRLAKKLFGKTEGISFSSDLLNGYALDYTKLGANNLKTVVSTIQKLSPEKNKYISFEKKSAESLHTYLSKFGYTSKLVLRKGHCVVTFEKSFLTEVSVSKEQYEGRVLCVTVKDGYIFVRAGGSCYVTGNCSLEPHLAAYVSGDKTLVDIFVNKQDFYSSIGIRQFGITDATPYKDDSPDSFPVKYPDLRNLVKVYALALFYGSGPNQIKNLLECTKEKAVELSEGFFSAYPIVQGFIKESHVLACSSGKIKTKFGRIRHLDRLKMLYEKHGFKLLDYRYVNRYGLRSEAGIFKNLLNNAVNYQVQGLAAHALNRAMLKFTRMSRHLDCYIAMCVHDEILVVSSKDHAEEANRLLAIAMEECIDISPIKLSSDGSIANSYGEAKK